jgi:DNA-binding transcriptional regulator of glucitol operon
MKKYFLLSVFIAACFPVFAAINHGSIMGNGLTLYPVRDGATSGTAVEGVTFDFKAVTIGTKTWVWTNLTGKNLAGNDWSSQFRWWSPVKQEYNLSNRIADTQQTYGIVGIPDINFCKPAILDANHCVITFLQEANDGFYETADFVYKYTQPNSAVASDRTPPVMSTPVVVSQTEQEIHLSLSATGNSENFFYYIEDAANNFAEVLFPNETVLNLEPDITYHFSVCAIDFSGNQSQAVPVLSLPDSIKNGSDFYVIYMDAVSEAFLGAKVQEKILFRDYDIWPDGQTLIVGTRSGENAWGVSARWVALDVAAGAVSTGWNGGAIVAKLNEFNNVPDLTAVTNNPGDYYFHFAIKSPVGQPSAGWILTFYSDGASGESAVKYYVGPDTEVVSVRGLPWLGDYAHDGQWHHFEIPVSELRARGYVWNGPLSDPQNGRVYLLGFQDPMNVAGTELNLDAVFFYKKPAQQVEPPAPVEPVLISEGTAQAVSFKIDSRSASGLKIECTSDSFICDAFVKLELNGTGIAGRWKPAIADPETGTKRYLITVPTAEVSGWTEGAVLGLNLAYKPVGGDYVTNNKIITSGNNAGLPALHRIGTGVDIIDPDIPDIPDPTPVFHLPDNIRNGSDFYIIYMDTVSETELGTKVKEKNMFRDYDIWPDGRTLTAATRTGENAWGISASWVALDVAADATSTGWNGGAIVAKLNEFDKVPDLSDITDNPGDYYFHFAIKSPVGQPSAGWILTFYSNGAPGESDVKYYVGPDAEIESVRGLPWLGDYAHDGQWHHFEIPVSQMRAKGYVWNGPLSAPYGKVSLLGFQDPRNVAGTELNLDAVFFYKKQAQQVAPPPAPVEPVLISEGTVQAVSFKIDSRSLNELKIECTSSSFIGDAFVKLELDGTELAGRWKPAIVNSTTGTKNYVITVPANEIHGWAEGAVLSLNLGYQPVGGSYVNDNKVITAGNNAGLPVLHRIGTGVDIFFSNLPDSIKNGSDFYIISMDTESEVSLGSKVKEKSMFCGYDIDTQTLTAATRTGINAWGVDVLAPWIALDVAASAASTGWNGGVIVAKLNEFNNVPDLKDITDNPDDYYFHFAIKSPVGQRAAGWILTFYSNGAPVKYYVGPDTEIASVRGLPWPGDYAHDGLWHHFEIPVSQLRAKGYVWSGPLSDTQNGKAFLLGFQELGNVAGTELNLDAIFFYKKPAQQVEPPAPVEPVLISEGTAQAVSFKIDSRLSNELKIVCTSSSFIGDAFVKLELNGTGVAGRWKPAIANPATGTKRYIITVPTAEISGWAEGAVLGLNLGYQPAGESYVTDNKVITAGNNTGRPILHKIGTGLSIGNEISVSILPDSIKNGSDFYIIFMDAESEAGLGSKVKEKSMFCDYDIWPDGQTLTAVTRTGVNAWGIDVSVPWIALDVALGATGIGWNGGAVVVDLSDKVPDLRAITNNPEDYYFHFAIKSPATQPSTGWTLIFYSDGASGDSVKYYVGPDTEIASMRGLPWLGDYAHDGQWHHFEIPVSQLRAKGYVWSRPLNVTGDATVPDSRYLLGFQSPNKVPGTELNLDAVFFYRKPAQSGGTPAPVTPVLITEGTVREVSFKLDSRSLNELTIECTSNSFISDAFVKLELNGTRLVGRWKPAIADPATGTKRCEITVPAAGVSGWTEGAILGLNLAYKLVGGDYVTDNKVITAGNNAGKPVLHRIGTGGDIIDPNLPEPYLPDSIRNGSNFYIIYMDPECEAELGTKVKEKSMLRAYDIWSGMTVGSRTGLNAWGVSASWVALDVVANAKWNGGAIVAVLDQFDKVPDLSDITNNPDDYYFHFAIKSPASQPDVTWTLELFSEADPQTALVDFYVGPRSENINYLLCPWLGNYAHDDQWHHFEIPVSELVARGYKWTGPMSADNGRVSLLSFKELFRTGIELNLDAIFFYKKPAAAGGK